LTLLVLGAVLAAMMAVPVAGASAAPLWRINGSTVTGEETVKITSTGTVKLEGWLATNVEHGTITCESAGSPIPPVFHEPAEEIQWYRQHPRPTIAGSGAGSWQIALAGCKFTQPATCHLGSERLTSGVLTSALADEGTNSVYDKFGTDSQEFLTYSFGGCNSEGHLTITGAPRCKIVEPGVEAVVKHCEFTATSGSTLKSVLRPVTFTATINMELSGANAGKHWTARF
jgi:hypothetical protein